MHLLPQIWHFVMYNMKEMIAFCGFDCMECPVCKATVKGDNQKLEGILLKESNQDIKIEDIYCYGCKSRKDKYYYCQICEIRKCCIDKKLDNCAYCSIFPCNMLKEAFKEYPRAKLRLEKIRNDKEI